MRPLLLSLALACLLCGEAATAQQAVSSPGPVRDPACQQRLDALALEQKASDAAHRPAAAIAELPLRQQYEQDIYYEEKRVKAFEFCLRKHKDPYDEASFNQAKSHLDMIRRACAVLARDCKGVKHW